MSPGWEDLWVPAGSRLGQDPLQQRRDPGSGEGHENAGDSAGPVLAQMLFVSSPGYRDPILQGQGLWAQQT